MEIEEVPQQRGSERRRKRSSDYMAKQPQPAQHARAGTGFKHQSKPNNWYKNKLDSAWKQQGSLSMPPVSYEPLPKPTEPKYPFSLGGTLQLFPSLRDSYTPDRVFDSETSFPCADNGVAIVKRLASAQFDPSSIHAV